MAISGHRGLRKCKKFVTGTLGAKFQYYRRDLLCCCFCVGGWVWWTKRKTLSYADRVFERVGCRGSWLCFFDAFHANVSVAGFGRGRERGGDGRKGRVGLAAARVAGAKREWGLHFAVGAVFVEFEWLGSRTPPLS